MSKVKALNPLETQDFMEKHEDLFILDVRTPGEFGTGHVENAINIPVHELTINLDQIPHEKPILVYCRSGQRCAVAAYELEDMGFENISFTTKGLEGLELVD